MGVGSRQRIRPEVLKARERADTERRDAIRQLILALGLIADGGDIKDLLGEFRPPMVKLLAARETIRHANRFLGRAIAHERRFNEFVCKRIKHAR